MPDSDLRSSARAFLATARGFALASVAVLIVSFVTAGELVAVARTRDIHGVCRDCTARRHRRLDRRTGGLAYARRSAWWTAVVADSRASIRSSKPPWGRATR